MARRVAEGPFGLYAWYGRAHAHFHPKLTFLASGTYSDNEFNPLRELAPMVTAGIPYTKPYDVVWWNYSVPAFMAGLKYALTQKDWDVVVNLDVETIVNDLDFELLLLDFLDRPELFLSPDWHGRPGGPFLAWKPEGARRYVEGRVCRDLIEKEDGKPEPMLMEDELGVIFKDSWWNPWPQFETLRQDFRSEMDEEVLRWPLIRQPTEAVLKRLPGQPGEVSVPKT